MERSMVLIEIRADNGPIRKYNQSWQAKKKWGAGFDFAPVKKKKSIFWNNGLIFGTYNEETYTYW